MLRITSSILLRQATKTRCRQILLPSSSCLVAKANYHRAVSNVWPEPLTQQTLDEFLHDINYFEEPRKFVNIGLHLNDKGEQVKDLKSKDRDGLNLNPEQDLGTLKPSSVDEVLELLSKDVVIPALDHDDIRVDNKDLTDLAINAGVFRDLFNTYVPDREHIKFTKQQADNLDKLVPYYWITDQPYARMNRHQQEPETLKYFEPVVNVSARFVRNTSSQEEMYAHTSYHGNIVPAQDCSMKPSITLDGKNLSGSSEIPEKQFNNWVPGQVNAVNFGQLQKFYTIALVNLDYLHENASHLHWMITDIEPLSNETLSYNEVCDYLPVHGIQGFGYSRYVFLVFQHDTQLSASEAKIEDFSISSRKFDPSAFLAKHQSHNLLPVGLSWFQTTWDESSTRVFRDIMNQKAPVFEHVQAKLEKRPQKAYPGRIPFNIYMDHFRSKKDINEQVLLERLKSIDPTDYKDQYLPPKVPPTVFKREEKIPSWMINVLMKKENKLGYWRGLRPASATLPLENNADLDYPIRPLASSRKSPPELHNEYGTGKNTYRPQFTMPYNRPSAEQSNIFIQEDHDIHLDAVKKIMKESEEQGGKK